MGRVDWIGCEAVGLPGQRTFRILARTGDQAAEMWLEKEQLQALVDAIMRMLAELGSEPEMDITGMAIGGTNAKPSDFPSNPAIEFQVGALGLRYDPTRDMIALEAFERNSEENDPPELRCIASRDQMERLQNNATEVIAGGRPKCPFCGTPLPAPGMPHFCPPTNGHHKLSDD